MIDAAVIIRLKIYILEVMALALWLIMTKKKQLSRMQFCSLYRVEGCLYMP